MATAPSCTLGDFFGARSCGAQLSGMTLAIKGNKSADATTPLRRTARDSWRADQIGPNWHAIPVRVPLADTEMKKMKITTTNPVTFKFYDFFQSKLGGPTVGQARGEKNKLREATGIIERMSGNDDWRPLDKIRQKR